MTSPIEQITVRCPYCATVYEDWYRASVNLDLDDFDEEYLEAAATATCPECGLKVNVSELSRGDDDIWELVDDRAQERQEFGELNRRMWNETAAVHERSQFARLKESFADPELTTLDELERGVFDWIGSTGCSVAQLACNNGRELISAERYLSASRAVGFDISDSFMEQAERSAKAAGSRAEFIRTNVYDIHPRFDRQFDIVFVTVGALGWLPDLTAWYRVVSRLLRPDGYLFIYEMHPVLDMFEAEQGPELRHSYFRSEPFVAESAPDYFAPEEVVEAPSAWFHHTLGSIINGALEAGLVLEEFGEHTHDVSEVYRSFAEMQAVPPMSYHLVARKG